MSSQSPLLDGITVLDLGQIYNAPYATLLLALAGARVIKVEPPSGENLRSRGKVPGAGPPFVMLNSNKEAITLNLKVPAGRALLEEMVVKADVLVENFRPGVMDKLGLGADHLRGMNPRLVYASGTGYGSSGPYRDYPAMDLTIQAMSGVMESTGFPECEPVKAGPAFGDFLGGVHLYGGIVTALFRRERTGEGSYVEVAMFDAVYPSLTSSLGMYFSGTKSPSRTGNRHSGLAESPYNVYPAADGYVALFCVTEQHWRNLVEVMGRGDLLERGDLSTRYGRATKMDELDEIVGSWTSRRDQATLTEQLLGAGVPCAPVRSVKDVVEDEHLLQRGMIVPIEHPQIGRVNVPHSPIRIGSYRRQIAPSRQLGEDNDSVYGEWLGREQWEIDSMRQNGVI